MWFWSILLRVPWTARGSNQSILKHIVRIIHRKDWCWSSKTLATWCEELIPWKRPWCWKSLKAGREGDNRGWDGWMASLTQWTWVWVNYRVGDVDRECCSPWGHKESDMTERLNWTETTVNLPPLKMKLRSMPPLNKYCRAFENKRKTDIESKLTVIRGDSRDRGTFGVWN